MFILKGILRAETQEKILLYLLTRETGYGKAMSDFFNVPLNPIQKQLARLEEDGVIVGGKIGAARVYQLNPHYLFIEPLRELLKAALSSYPQAVRAQLLMDRKRQRMAGKPVVLAVQNESHGG